MPLISFFHYSDVLMESFTLIISKVSTIFRKIVQMTMKKYIFILILVPSSLQFCISSSTSCLYCLLYYSKENSESPYLKGAQAFDSKLLSDSMKYGSFTSFLMSGPSKIPIFCFSVLIPGDVLYEYSK